MGYGLFRHHPEPGPPGSLGLYRALMLAAGAAYLLWWGTVEVFLHGSFNPLLSRLAVVLTCWTLFVASFVSRSVSRHAGAWLSACLWLVTIHYFYLFHHNLADINWVVGSYILVIPICACLQSERALLGYSAWVLFLSVLLSLLDRKLLGTVFLPGMATILVFAWVGLRARLRLTETARETSQRFQTLFDSVFEGIVVHEHGAVIDANSSFAAIFGYRLPEVIGMAVTELLAPECRAAAIDKIESMSETPYQATGLRKDGSRILIEIRGKRHTLDGKLLRLAAINDITDRHEIERERILHEASRRAIEIRDEFLSIASHELKTPLTNLRLQTQMVLRGLRRGEKNALDAERMRKFVELTDRQADRLNRLVDEMLDVARISSDKLTIQEEDLELVELVRGVAATFDASFRESGSPLIFEAPSPIWIRADRFRMEQVVSNLFSNAIKYGNREPIRVRVSQAGAEVRLAVEDRGLGISEEHQQRIFERFERAVPGTNISGLGLGLYISRYLVERMSGRIKVESQPGRGSCFTVSLPVAPASRKAS